MNVLPTFRGFTVDVRLREFRKAVFGKMLEFVPFDSPRGRRLIKAYKHQSTRRIQ